jgi:hypothetical protein
MIYESLGLFGLSNPTINRDRCSLVIYESLGLFGLSNPSITRDHISYVIYESLGAVWAVESIRHPWQQFTDDL